MIFHEYNDKADLPQWSVAELRSGAASYYTLHLGNQFLVIIM